ncbi:hypothetical protein pEaSNUABM39_00143 [Erwinia phage pEa_SNUABM_39]|nr:hypothetical protein pEaSNUABM39_00143 [Erwinia phage pEa_SNUABM_39]
MIEGLFIVDYSYFRYLGPDAMISNGVHMQTREVVGLLKVSDDLYYIAHPKYDMAYAISGEDGARIIENSRPFTAKPDALFKPGFDFTHYEEKKKEAAPKPKPKPVPVKVQPEPEQPAPQADPVPEGGGTPESLKARMRRLQDMPLFGTKKALVYANANYPGGTPNNYAVQKIPKCGNVHLEVLGADDLLIGGRKILLEGVSPPDYVLKDIQENVMPGIGLNVPLPFKRLYVGIVKQGNDVGGSHIMTYTVSGFLYGVISMSPKQLVELFGGYNSRSFGHAMTHELAHFVDHTMIRNVDRMKFEQAIRGKKIHPDSLDARTMKSVPTEHPCRANGLG